MTNCIFTIKPYKWNGTWVFDDESVGLVREAFVAGADTMIDTATAALGIDNAEDGFLLFFSKMPFQGHDFQLRRVGGDRTTGTTYDATIEVDGEPVEMQGWLCPALNLYFPESPQNIFVQLGKISG